jgi:hypothetical protein
MKKIVILCDPSEENDRLITCLRILFPECEIQVQPRGVGNFGDVPTVPEPAKTEKGTENDVKYFGCR